MATIARFILVLLGILVGLPLAFLRGVFYAAWDTSNKILIDIFPHEIMTKEEYEKQNKNRQ